MTATAATDARAPRAARRPKNPFARRRRNAELGLGVHSVVIVIGAYGLLALADGTQLPPDFPLLLAGVASLYVVAHLAVRRFAPGADGTLLPLVATLNGLGYVTITRLNKNLAREQAVWIAIGVGVFVVTLIVVRDVRLLERYRYTCALAGLGFLLLPLVPSPVGRTIGGARLWAKVGPVVFQPGEIAKVLLVVFFAGYLVDKRELLSQGSRRIGRLHVPDPKHLGPLLGIWGVSIVVLVAEKDLGSSLMLFSVFAAMLYIATNRSAYLVGGVALFSIGATAAYKMFDHVRVRVSIWRNPWPQAHDKGLQIVQSWYAFASGGFTGRGLGLGLPHTIPLVETDFIFAAIGEELGLLGAVAIVTLYLLLVGSGMRIAVDHPSPFSKLFAAGLTVVLGVQAFVIIGGVTRLIPLTGITLPFISYGGSSLVANFALVALLARVSDDATRRGTLHPRSPALAPPGARA